MLSRKIECNKITSSSLPREKFEKVNKKKMSECNADEKGSLRIRSFGLKSHYIQSLYSITIKIDLNDCINVI